MDGTGSAARFNYPAGVAADSAGNVYVTEQYNYTIRKLTPSGEVTRIGGLPGIFGSADGAESVAQFNVPTGIAVDSAGKRLCGGHRQLQFIREAHAGACVAFPRHQV